MREKNIRASKPTVEFESVCELKKLLLVAINRFQRGTRIIVIDMFFATPFWQSFGVLNDICKWRSFSPRWTFDRSCKQLFREKIRDRVTADLCHIQWRNFGCAAQWNAISLGNLQYFLFIKTVRRTFDAITSNEALLALQLVGLCKTPTEVLNRVVKWASNLCGSRWMYSNGYVIRSFQLQHREIPEM